MSDPAIDVLVIGSGFGGAVAANRLALAGKRVLVLERGPWRDSVPVRSMGITRRSPFPFGKKAFAYVLHSFQGQRFGLRWNKRGVYEIGSFSGMYTLAASGVGGGSIVYGGMLDLPRRSDYWANHHPLLKPADIERYYDKVIQDMGGVPISPTQPLPESIWDIFPEPHDPRCHPAKDQPLLGVLIPPTAAQAGELAPADGSGVERRYCAFDGDYVLGSRGGAKASVDFVYLAPVLNKGATVRDLCEVTQLKPAATAGGTGYLVQFRDVATGALETAHAPVVVLAAGALNTLRLLFASVDQTNGLAAMPALGKNFFGNGDLSGVWINPETKTSTFHAAPALGELTVQGSENRPIGIGSLGGFDTWPLPGFIKRILSKMFFVYGMGFDSIRASVTLVKGRLRSNYDYQSEPIYDELRRAFRLISEVSGKRIIAFKKPVTPHMGGVARVGATAERGVIDHRGEVYGNPGLYIVDAAALPGPTGGPPSVAVAAWAHYVADGIAQKH